MLTVADLRWAQREAQELAREYVGEMYELWTDRAARFRAAAEAMEREGKRDE